MNNYEEMKIESDVFTTARENFDLLMQRLFASMEKNNSDEGSMRLKDLVGKMAIRTAEPFSTEPPSGIVTGFGLFGKPTVFRFNQKYMDEPVKIVNVKEDQVVIEDNGERKLLERKFIDEHWTDYDKFLHPEKEEQEKLENMVKEIKAAAEPLRRFLEKYYDPMVKVTVEADRVIVERGEFQTLFQEGEPDETEDAE